MKGYKTMTTVTMVLAALWLADGNSRTAWALKGKIKKSDTLSVKTSAQKPVLKSTSGKKTTVEPDAPAAKISKKQRRITKIKKSSGGKRAAKRLKFKNDGKKMLIPAVKTAPQAQASEGRPISLKARERALARLKKPLLLSKRTYMTAVKTAPETPGVQPDIHVPDTIKDPKLDPRFDWLRHQFSRQQEMDRWLKSPVHDMIDPNTTGMPGPDRAPSKTNEDAWWQWLYSENATDISGQLDSDSWDDATISKVATATGSGFVTANPFGDFIPADYYPFDVEEDSDSQEKSKSEKSTGDEAEEEVDVANISEEIIEEDPEDTQDANRDADPEGDDPDEIRSALLAEAAFATGTGQGSRSSGGDTPIQRSTGENGGGLGQIWWENTGGGSPLPEDGRPDESASPSAAGQISHSMAGGVAQYPAPGDDDPDDPRAGGGGIRITMNMSAAASSPIDGGQGDEPLPPGPGPK